MGKGPTNPAPADNTANVVTIDGSLGDVQYAALSANSTFNVKNVARGQVVTLLTSASGGNRTFTPEASPTQAIGMAGNVASFTIKSGVGGGIQVFGAIGGGCIVSQLWDGLYA